MKNCESNIGSRGADQAGMGGLESPGLAVAVVCSSNMNRQAHPAVENAREMSIGSFTPAFTDPDSLQVDGSACQIVKKGLQCGKFRNRRQGEV